MSHPKQPQVRPWQRWLLALSCFPAAIILISLLAPWWAGSVWSNWTVQATFLLLPALMLLRHRAPWAALLLTLMAIGCARWLVAAFEPRLGVPAVTQPTLSLVSANVAGWNPWRLAADEKAGRDGPDLLLLVEVGKADRAQFAGDARWPYQFWDDGLGLLSRLPLQQARSNNQNGLPVIEAGIGLQGRSLHLICVHTLSPGSPSRLKNRDHELVRLAELVNAQPGPTLILGDFNLTVGDPSWPVFRNASGVMRPVSESATWPSVFGPFGITIDHVLGKQVAISAVDPIWLAGSDHRGIQARIALLP